MTLRNKKLLKVAKNGISNVTNKTKENCGLSNTTVNKQNFNKKCDKKP
jgi:hypothetical protein